MFSKLENLSKKQLLIYGLVFDGFGMIPLLNFIWAPLSAFLMIKLYKGNVGKIGGMVSFIEEVIPGLNFFPSFTLTWIYVFVLKRGETVNQYT